MDSWPVAWLVGTTVGGSPFYPVQERLPATIDAEPVRKFAIIVSLEDGDVCVLAHFDTSLSALQPERASAVISGGGDGLGRRHFHMRAGGGQHERHRWSGRRAWIVVGRQRNRDTGIDQLAGGWKVRQSQKVVSGGKEGGDGVEFGQHGNIFVADIVHVVERGRMKLHQRRQLSRGQL